MLVFVVSLVVSGSGMATAPVATTVMALVFRQNVPQYTACRCATKGVERVALRQYRAGGSTQARANHCVVLFAAMGSAARNGNGGDADHQNAGDSLIL